MLPERAVTILGSLAVLLVVLPAAAATAEPGDPARGAQQFRACAACHSLQPGRNMTGPSLAGVWGRQAGTLSGFDRYSPALKASNLIWNEKSLDPWLDHPQKLVPNTRMVFNGIRDEQARADLIAFLKQVSASPEKAPRMPTPPDLKQVSADQRVTAIRHCRDTYRVTTAAGETLAFWERNLRFKTDSSERGPAPGAPALMGAGMKGDRSSVIFAAPEEISASIRNEC